jgi:sterol 24-C-methyltransferase
MHCPWVNRLGVVLVSGTNKRYMKKKMRSVVLILSVLGGPAREIAHFTGAHITGLNNNAYQVERAFHYAAKEGLQNQTNFIKVNKK